MFCHKCGSTLANDAVFCSRCGARMPTGEAQDAAAPPASPPVQAPVMPAPVAPAAPARGAPMGVAPAASPAYPAMVPSTGVLTAEAQISARAGTATADPRLEVDKWTGRYSAKALAQYYLGLAAWTIIVIVIASYAKAGPWWLWAALILLPAAGVFGRLLYCKWTIKYRLTTQRFFHTYGFAVQRTDETELLKVDDITLEQTLLERMFDVGTLIMESSDKSEPRKVIRGIAHPIEVKEFVRSYALQARQGQNVMRVHSM